VRQACLKIKELTLEKGYRYSDIAIITGDMKNHAPYLEREAQKYAIPLYLDRTSGIESNPFIEYIRSALAVIVQNYSYTSVFRFLRSGFTTIPNYEIDLLEDYVIACGIKGKKAWHEPFTRQMARWIVWQEAEQSEEELSEAKEKAEKNLARINEIREKVVFALFVPDQELKTAGDIIRALYGFLVPKPEDNSEGSEDTLKKRNAYWKLKRYEETFTEQGDLVRAKEYSQIFRLVMELFEQIYGLLGNEKLSWEEFAEILDAGLLEIKVGTIPQNIDRIVVGDIERTRLKQIKALFFLGVNDGNIPAGTGAGGLISDLDREFLQESEWALAPTPRQRMYNQRLYLYMIMAKPSERLYLSYVRYDSEGKGLRPSYLIKTVQQLFPSLTVALANETPSLENVYGMQDSLDVFTTKLRDYAADFAGKSDEANLSDLGALSYIYRQSDDDEYRQTMEGLLAAAFQRYSPQKLSSTATWLLYGLMKDISVSRLEKYASCAYAHFLQYGLRLREREEYSFEVADLGNVYHGVLDAFAKTLAKDNLKWAEIKDKKSQQLLEKVISDYVQNYGESVLANSSRSQHMVNRIRRILKRAEGTMREHLRQGEFVPNGFEVGFSEWDALPAAGVFLEPLFSNPLGLPPGSVLPLPELLSLRGRIDRIDVCVLEDKVLVKVIDYKSGQKDFDLSALYHGRQLQLAVYLNVAMDMMAKQYPDKAIEPAAALYYRIFDPMISTNEELADADLQAKLLKEQRMTGIVNDDKEIAKRLDKGFGQSPWTSNVIPVATKKDGDYYAYSKVLSSDGFQLVRDYLRYKIAEMGRKIKKEGDIAVYPSEYGTDNGCRYCEFKQVCGFDLRLPGYSTNKMTKMKNAEVLALMEPYRKDEE
jgi:ATP-dependent helicase/nuclease subunit B